MMKEMATWNVKGKKRAPVSEAYVQSFASSLNGLPRVRCRAENRMVNRVARFFVTTYQNGENITNDQKIHQKMAGN
jgi:hypothetical protein